MFRQTDIFIFCALLLSGFAPPASGQSGWNALNSGTTNDLFAVHFVSMDTGFVAGGAGTVLKTADGGASWHNVSPGGITASCNGLYAFDVSRVIVVGDDGMILLTTDGGTNWFPVSSGVTDDIFSVSFFSGVGLCGGASQTILRSTDAGASWTIVQSGFFGGGFWGTCLLSPQIAFVAGENSIFQPLAGKTSNGGDTWTFTAFYLDNNEGRIHGVDFTDQFTGYAAAGVWDGRGAVSRTSNGGTDWSTIFFPEVLRAVDFPISATGLTGYAVGEAGRIVRTVNAGIVWQQQTSGISTTLHGVHFPEIYLGYVVGESGVVLKTTTGGEPPVNVDNDPSPRSFSILQNYPNPFNPGTTIVYEVASRGPVNLKVFDLLGKEVAILVDEAKDVGVYRVKFSTGDGNDWPLPGGMYFYRLETGGTIRVNKMILLR